VKLGREAAEKCLERANLKPEDIDLIITVSCTGFMIPSLDAHLINLMGFRSNVRRMPFTETGMRCGSDGVGARRRIPEGAARRERADHRCGAAIADVSAKRYFTGKPDFVDFVWRRRGGSGGQRERGARAEGPFPSQIMMLFAHDPNRPGGGAMYMSAWFEETEESSEKNTLLERLSLGPRVALHFQNASWRGAAWRTSKIRPSPGAAAASSGSSRRCCDHPERFDRGPPASS